MWQSLLRKKIRFHVERNQSRAYARKKQKNKVRSPVGFRKEDRRKKTDVSYYRYQLTGYKIFVGTRGSSGFTLGELTAIYFEELESDQKEKNKNSPHVTPTAT